tara:strand:+ start:661 stop:1059 length:399 start_codon:yes stop_codon:yes gene_type:complete
MNNQKRRTFRPRHKSNFRPRSNGHRPNDNGHFQSNGNNNFGRNGSMTNPFNVEKTIQKYQQLAKDAQTLGDPVLVENYLQHADHFSRRLQELNLKNKPRETSNENKTLIKDEELTNKKEVSSNVESPTEKKD